MNPSSSSAFRFDAYGAPPAVDAAAGALFKPTGPLFKPAVARPPTYAAPTTARDISLRKKKNLRDALQEELEREVVLHTKINDRSLEINNLEARIKTLDEEIESPKKGGRKSKKSKSRKPKSRKPKSKKTKKTRR